MELLIKCIKGHDGKYRNTVLAKTVAFLTVLVALNNVDTALSDLCVWLDSYVGYQYQLINTQMIYKKRMEIYLEIN